jgi:hypothetical protein
MPTWTQVMQRENLEEERYAPNYGHLWLEAGSQIHQIAINTQLG